MIKLTNYLEVHGESQTAVWLSFLHIVSMIRPIEHSSTTILTVTGVCYDVYEAPEEILSLIEAS